MGLYSSTLSIFMAESAFDGLLDELTDLTDQHLRDYGIPTADEIYDTFIENGDADGYLPYGEDHFNAAFTRRIDRLIQERIDYLADYEPYNLHPSIRKELTL